MSRSNPQKTRKVCGHHVGDPSDELEHLLRYPKMASVVALPAWLGMGEGSATSHTGPGRHVKGNNMRARRKKHILTRNSSTTSCQVSLIDSKFQCRPILDSHTKMDPTATVHNAYGQPGHQARCNHAPTEKDEKLQRAGVAGGRPATHLG